MRKPQNSTGSLVSAATRVVEPLLASAGVSGHSRRVARARSVRMLGAMIGLGLCGSVMGDPAAYIGVNFAGGSNGGAPTNLAASDMAGLLPQANYNNMAGTTGSALPLVDANGAATAATFTFAGAGTWGIGANQGTDFSTAADPNLRMYNGYLDGTDNGTNTYAFNNLSPGSYNLIIYTLADGLDGRDEHFTVNGDAFNAVYVSMDAGANPSTNGFVRATATTLNGTGATGNYVEFDNLVALNGSISFTGTSDTFRNFVNAIQLVRVQQGSNKTWSGSISSTWDTTTNNFTGTNYNEGDAAVFADVDGNNVPVTNRNITIQSGGVSPASGVTVNNNSGAYTFNGAILNTTLLKAGFDSATLAGTTDNNGLNVRVTQGTMVLGKTSSATVHAAYGASVDSGATLKLSGSGGNQIADSGNVTLNGTLDMGGLSEAINGLAGSNTGAIANNGTSPVTLTVGAGNGGGTFAGSINDGNASVKLVKAGTGAQTLTGTNGFTGGIDITGGALWMGGASANTENLSGLGSGPISISGGGMLAFGGSAANAPTPSDYQYGNTITLDNGTILGADGVHHLTGNVTVNAGGGTLRAALAGRNLSIEGTMSGSGPLTIATGSGAVAIQGSNPGFTGPVTVNGSLIVGQPGALGPGTSRVTVNEGGQMDISSTGGLTVGSLAGGGNVTLGFSNLTAGGDNTDSTYSGAISGGGGLTKTGTGTMTIGGLNRYTGTTTIQGGTLKLGTSQLTPGLFEGLVVNTAGVSAAFDTGDPIPHTSVQLTTRLANTTAAQQTFPTGVPDNSTVGYSGFINVPGGAPQIITFGENFDDSVRLVVDGTQILNDTVWNAQTTGSITLAPGRHSIELRVGQGGGGVGPANGGVGGTSNLGVAYSTDGGASWKALTDPGNASLLSTTGGSALPVGTALVMSSNTTFDLNGNVANIGSLSDDPVGATGHKILLNGGTLNSFSDNTFTTFSGSISGAGNFTKGGNGTLTLSGNNTYTGTTRIAGGTLTLANSSSTNNISGSAVVSIASGATLDVNQLSGGKLVLGAQKLTGAGTISGSVDVGGTGTLAPGDSSIGTLTVNGGLSLANNATASFILGSPGTSDASPGLSSLASIQGNLTLGTNLTFIPVDNSGANGQGALDNGTYRLFEYSGSLTGFTANTFHVPAGTRGTYTFLNQNNHIDLVVSGLLSLAWTGATDGKWDTTTSNWANGNVAALYNDIAIVSFGDTSPINNQPITNNNVTIQAGGVSPLAINLKNNTVNYTFNSADTVGIAGPGAITKNGTGDVTLAGPNSFSGGVTINSGSITLANAAALGNSSGVAVNNGGTLRIQGAITTSKAIPLTLNGNGSGSGALVSLSGANVYTGPVTLATPTTINVVADSLNLTGAVSGGAPFTTSLTKTGAGTLRLSAADSYVGNTTVAGGVLRVGNATALGANNNTVTVNSGAAFDFGGTGINGHGYTISIAGNGTGAADTGALYNSGAGQNNASFDTVTLTADSSIGSNGGRFDIYRGSTTGTAVNGGGFNLTKVGTNFTSILGPSFGLNTIVINNGTLNAEDDGAFGFNTPVIVNAPGIASAYGVGTFPTPGRTLGNNYTLNGGTIQNTNAQYHVYNGQITINATSGGRFDITNSAGRNDFNGQIIGTGKLTKTGVGLAVLATDNSATFSGPIDINGGTLRVGVANALGAGTSRVTFGGGTLDLNNNNTTVGSIAGSGGITLGTATLTTGGDNTSSNFSGGANGSGGLTKVGSGTLTLSGSNTYTGPTLIQAGTLKMGPAGTLAAGLFEGVVVNGQGASAAFDTTDPIPATSIQLNPRFANITTSQSTYPTGWPDNTTIGYRGLLNIPAGANQTLTFGEQFDDNVLLTIDGQTILNNQTWNQQTTGSITLAPGRHTFNLRLGQGGGGAAVNNGGVGGSGLGVAYSTDGGTTWRPIADPGDASFLTTGTAANNLPATSAVIMSSNTNFDINGNTVTIGSLAEDPGATGHTVALNGGTLRLGNDNTSTSFSGAITGGGNLVKVGTGAFTLVGNQAYTAATRVAGGTLTLSSPSSTNSIPNSSAIVVLSGGTLDLSGLSGGAIALGAQKLGGTGTVSGSVSTAAGSNISAGDLPITTGTLSITGNLSVANGTTITPILGAPGTSAASPGVGGTTAVGGNLTLGTGLPFNPIATGPSAGFYTLFTYAGSLSGFTGAGNFILPPRGTYSFINDTANHRIEFQMSGLTPVTWTGQTNGNWDYASVNWTDGAVNDSFRGDAVTFADTNPVTLAPITQNNVTLAAGGIYPQSVTFNNSAVNYTVTSPDAIGITGATGITKNGTGTVTLAGINSFTGPVAINAGAIRIVNAGALGATPGITVASGGSLQLDGGVVSNPIPLTLNGPGVTGSPAGALNSISGLNAYSGAITLGSDSTITSSAGTLRVTGGVTTGGFGLTVDGAGDSAIQTGLITGAGSLTKNGTGTLTLTGAHPFTGGTTVNGGTLVLATGGQVATLAPGTTLTINNGGTVRGGVTDALGYNGAVGTGDVTVKINSGGTLTTATNARITLWNDVTMVGGTITSGTDNGDGNGNYSLDGVMNATSDSAGNPSRITATRMGLQIAGGISNSRTFNVTHGGAAAGAPDLIVTSILSSFSAGTGFTKTGDGVMVLANPANTYTGATVVSAGTLRVGDGTTTNGSVSNAVTNNATLNWANPTDQTYAGVISGSGNLVKSGAGALTLSAAQTYTGPTEVAQGKLVLGAAQTIGDVTVDAAGTLQMQNTQHLGKLTINGGTASVDAGHNKVIVATGLSMSGSGQLDLTDNDMIVTYAAGNSPEADIQTYRNNWANNTAGPKLMASSAGDTTVSQFSRTLAVADNANVQFTSFAGQTFAPGDFNQILVKYTYLGDANLDGQVTPTDYAIVDGNIGSNHDWGRGDLNGDGNTTPADYAQIDGNIGAGNGSVNGGPQLAVVVPEPSSIASILLVGAAGLLRRRRRRD